MPSLEAGGDVGCRNSARLPLPTTAKSSIQKHAFVFRTSHAKLPQLSNGYGSAQNSALEGFGDFSILVASLFPHPPSTLPPTLMAMDISIYDSLDTIRNSVLKWNARLDELNGQIPNRQLELARSTEKDRPPTRSLKNKDSISGDPSNADDAQIDPFDSPNLHENGSAAPAPRLSSSTTSRKLGIASILPLGSRLVSQINRMSTYYSRNFNFRNFSNWDSFLETAPLPYITSITNISLDGLSSLRILYPSAQTWCKALVLPPNDGGHFESATISWRRINSTTLQANTASSVSSCACHYTKTKDRIACFGRIKSTETQT